MAERLQRTEQARRDFVVDASRDLAGPLQGIIDESAAASLDNVTRLAVHLQETVGGLLDLATLEIQTDPLLLEETDFSLMMDRVISSSENRAAESSVVLIREDTLDVPVLAKVDSVRMAHAISGLINYAIHATGEPKEVRIALSYDGKSVFFSVTSMGAVVEAEELPFLFERFLGRKALSGRETLPDSSGAGLPAARRIIELHGGSIEVKMGALLGVTFFARVPRRVTGAL
jgi:signal transduction histidine kinase